MAKTKSKQRKGSRKDKKERLSGGSKTAGNPFASSVTNTAPESTTKVVDEPSMKELVTKASEFLHVESSPDKALELVTRALQINPEFLPAIELAGEIYVELGDTALGLQAFEKAVALDPVGLLEDEGGSGPEKFLCMAQLCEEGGEVAVRWYERGVEVLRRFIGILEGSRAEDVARRNRFKERSLHAQLCSALCAMTEIYMTDLWYVGTV